MRAIVAAPLLVAAAWVVLLRSPITGSLLLPAVSKALNLDVDAASVYVRLRGDLVVDGAEVRVPGVPGRAGQILQVDRLVADVNWWSTLWGSPSVHEVQLHGPLVRISQAVEDGSLNIQGVRLPEGDDDGTATPPPAVRVIDGALELGEHRGGVYTPLKRLSIAGLAAPVVEDGEPGYDVRLHQRAPRPGETQGDGFRIDGRWRGDRFELVMDDFSLDEWPDTSLPTTVRSLFNQLNLHGRISRATFRYAEDGPAAELTLDDVAMNLPIEAQVEGPPSPQARPMLMHGVDGTITVTRRRVTADLDGRVEDLPYKVTLTYEGTSPDAPFTLEVVSEGFKVQENPRLLPYAPGTVRRRLAQFSSPTAEMTTRLIVRRGEPVDGRPGPTSVAGTIELRNGVASYEKFPYEFKDLSGLIRFNDEAIDVVRITGRSPSGATVSATGQIYPPGPGASVDLDIIVENAPLDAATEGAFVGKRRKIITALFNRERYAELLDKGLVLAPGDADRLREQLAATRSQLATLAPGDERAAALAEQAAELERRLGAPEFPFGGIADVRIKLHRPYGDEVEWDSTVVVEIEQAGVLPEHFPFPMVGENLVIRVEDEVARVMSGRFRGLAGGTATVQATARLEDESGNTVPIRPDVTVEASGLPIDPLFVNALPGPDLAPGEEGFSTKRMLREIGLAGAVAGTAHIQPRDDGELGFDVQIAGEDLTATPAGPNGRPRLRIDGLRGTLAASEERLSTTLDGRIVPPAGSPAPLRLGVDVLFDEANERGGVDLDVAVASHGFALDLPVEDLVAPVSASSALQIAELRERHNPAGWGDVDAAVAMRGGELTDLSVRLDGLRDLALDLFGGRIAAQGRVGGAVVARPQAGVLTFEDLSAPVMFNDSATGGVRLAGEYAFAGDENGPEHAAAPLSIAVRGGWFESTLVRQLAGDGMGPDLSATMTSLDPRGRFDADLVLTGSGEDAALNGRVRPRTLDLTLRGQTVAFERVEGEVDFDAGAGILRRLTLHAPEWSATLDGSWRREPTGATSLRTKLELDGRRLTPDLRAALPEALDAVLAGIDLRADGPFSLADGHLAVVRSEDPAERAVEFTGGIAFSGVGFDVGALITEASGRVDARYEQPAGEKAAYELGISAQRLLLGGVQVTDARASLLSGREEGEVVVPSLSGRVHGGRLAGRARSALTPRGPRDYLVEAKLSGARFAPVLEELRRQLPPPPTTPGSAPARPADARTTLDAEVTLAGLVDVPSSRRGRGLLRMSDGEVLTLPLVLRLIEISNLQLPLSERLDYAHASFFVDGATVVFDDISVISRAVSLLGYGTMSWPEKELDLRFNSKSSRRIPVLSDLVEGIRDELVTAAVLGRVGEHRVELRQFSGARRMLGRAVGADETDQARRLDEIERLASEGPTRLPRRIEGIRPTPEAAPQPREEHQPSNAPPTPSRTGSSSTRP